MDPRLIEEIVARVAAKLAELQLTTGEVCKEPVCEKRPGLLAITQEHGECCNDLLECEEIKAHFRTECALLNEYKVDLADCEAVVLFQLTCDTLAKLASGMCDTPYTRLASQAILMGKKVYIPAEEVELYQYADTAPKAYYNMMKAKLDLLMDSGVEICPMCDLPQAILAGQAAPVAAEPTCCCEAAPEPDPVPAPVSPAPAPVVPAVPAPVEVEPPYTLEKEMRVDKRVLTERDVSEAGYAKFTVIRVSERCILTDLAKDYAKSHGIRLIREE